MIDAAYPTFVVTALPRARRTLRRYQGLHGGWACMPAGRHEALVNLSGNVPLPLDSLRRVFTLAESTALKPIPAAMWPARCSSPHCPGATQDGRPTLAPYAFQPGDTADVLHERLGQREDTGEEVVLWSPPPGGVVDHTYLARPGDDGRCLAVWTLDGWWYLDVMGRAGERFERRGAGAALTVQQTAGPPWRWSLVDGVLAEVRGAR